MAKDDLTTGEMVWEHRLIVSMNSVSDMLCSSTLKGKHLQLIPAAHIIRSIDLFTPNLNDVCLAMDLACYHYHWKRGFCSAVRMRYGLELEVTWLGSCTRI